VYVHTYKVYTVFIVYAKQEDYMNSSFWQLNYLTVYVTISVTDKEDDL